MWRAFFSRLARDLFTYEAAELNWQAGVRNALGIILPLLLGLIFHQLATAVVMSVGAIVTGFAGLSGTWQKRSRVMLWAVLWVSTAALLGGLTGSTIIFAIILVVLSGGLAGMFAAVSPEMALIGTLATNALIIFSGLVIPPGDALPTALKVFSGGILQWLFMLLMVPWQPKADGTASLRRVCRHLAFYTLHPVRSADLRVARALIVAESRIADRAIPAEKRWRLGTLLRRLDTARSDLVSLHHSQGVLEDSFFETVSAFLTLLAQKISTDPRATLPQDALQPLCAQVDAMASRSEVPVTVLARARHLVDTLDSVLDARIDPDAEIGVENWTIPSLKSLLSTIRKNLSLSRSAFRHALRIMGTLTVGLTLEHLLHIPRGYWVALTALVVLKADFFSTIGRGLARVLGTAAGVVIGSLLVALSGHQAVWVTLAMVVFAYAMYALLNVNYTLFSAMVSGGIVMLLSFFERIPPFMAMDDRLQATLFGSALALVAFLVFPTWQKGEVPKTLANLIDSEARYLSAILTGTLPSLARRNTRVARTAAATSLDHALNEPTPGPLDRTLGMRLMDVLHDIAELLMALEVMDPDYVASLRPWLEVEVKRLESLGQMLHHWPPVALPEFQEEGMAPPLPVAFRLHTLVSDAFQLFLPQEG